MYVQPGSMYAPQTYPIATHPGFTAPIAGGAQLTPQGFIGHLLGQYGQPQFGGQPWQALGWLGSLLPLQAAPMMPPGGWQQWQPTYPLGTQLASQWPYGAIVPPQLGSHQPFQSIPIGTPVA